MDFCDKLNEYIKKIECSSKDIVEASGLSSTVISRYRKGDRTPNLKSDQLEKLVIGLAKICKNKNIDIKEDKIYEDLLHSLNGITIESEQLSNNFNEIIYILNINMAELSRFIGYDASFLSKIRNGTRFPSKPQDFIEAISNFIVLKYNEKEYKKKISLLINIPIESLDNTNEYKRQIKKWISSNNPKSNTNITNFLENLDKFNLNEYIEAIHFNDLKVPFIPFYKVTSRNYYGLEEIKKGELDFFKATVLSKSSEPVFMCSDMPMEDMAQDIEFGKKWMYAIAMVLKKGLHLNIIHNLDRPFKEMMLGLESWIPIYMTGQVSPYYLPSTNNNIYNHLNYTSGTVALNGECINGYHKSTKYYLTNKKEEVSYYKTKSEQLLNKAKPLMKIYRIENKNAFHSFVLSSEKINATRKRTLSSLPIHTISKPLLQKILKYNNISEQESKKIILEISKYNDAIKKMIDNNIFIDEIPIIDKKEFENSPLSLLLSNIFYESKIYYKYEDYLEHLEMTKEFEKNNSNYKLILKPFNTFKNIDLFICKNNWIMISKTNSPSIHFVIQHPKLMNAIENFTPPIIEKNDSK